MKLKNIFFTAFMLFALSSCSDPRSVESCVANKIADQDFLVHCGFQKPEDIEKIQINGVDFLIISQMSQEFLSNAGTGGIVYYNTETGEKKLADISIKKATQGQNNCLPKRQQLSPHGIFLYQLDNNVQSDYLAVINHEGGNDRIELFEMDTENLALQWVGCIVAQPDVLLNDLVVKRNGDVFATQMLNRSDSTFNTLWNLITGSSTGAVQHWQIDGVRMKAIAGTEGTLPNGIAMTPAGHILVSYTGQNNVKQYDEAGHLIRTYEDIPAPDNMVLDEKGLIWVASNNELLQSTICDEQEYQEACPLDYSVHIIDAKQGISYPVIETASFLDSFGALSVAYPIYGSNQKVKVWLGSWAGKRIAVSTIKLAQ